MSATLITGRALTSGRAYVEGRGTATPSASGGSPSGGGGGTPTPPAAPVVLVLPTDPLSIGQTSATVTVSVDEVCNAYVEYGESILYGETTAEETSFVYSTHIQTIQNLTPDTEYHYRWVLTDQDDNVTYSDDRSFTTVALPAPEVPEIDEGMTYSATYTAQTGAGYTDGSDARAALQTWINSIPSGASTTNHVLVEFPAGFTWIIGYGLNVTGKSHWTIKGGGTETTDGQAGGATIKTTGQATSQANFNGKSSVWVMRSAASTVSAEDIRFHGFTITGTCTQGGTTTAANAGEYQHGFFIAAGKDILISHCVIDRVQGDAVYMTDGRNGGAIEGQYYSRGIVIRNSTLKRNGRMLVAVHHAQGVTIEDCRFEDAAYAHFDFEPDWPSPYATSGNVYIRRCVFAGRHQWDPSSNAGVILHTRIVGVAGTFTRMGTWEISDCRFESINNTNPNYGYLHLWLGPIIGGTLLLTNNVCTVPAIGNQIVFRNFTGGATVTNNTGFCSSGSVILNGGNNGSETISGNT